MQAYGFWHLCTQLRRHGFLSGGGVGAMTSKPAYLPIPPIFCFSSVLGYFLLVTHRLHTFRYFFRTKKEKNVTSLRRAGLRAYYDWSTKRGVKFFLK